LGDLPDSVRREGLASAILEAALDCVIVMDHEGRVLEFNSAAQRTFGYTRAKAIGRELAELIIPPEARGRHRAALARYLATGKSRILGRRLEFVGMRADGARIPVELTVTRIPGSEPPSFAGYVRDISDRTRWREEIEAALARERAARAEAERQRFGSRRLVAQTLHAEESERRRLAQALHDGPVQDLLAAQFELGRLRQRAGEGGSRANAAVGHALGQLREAIFDLYPPALERVGLGAAIQELAAELSRRVGRDMRISADVAPEVAGVHDQLLFSLSRELLSNAVRHAHADQIALRAWREQYELILEVEDNGIGLPEQVREKALREGHIGLASSTERVEALGGWLAIGPGMKGGTLARVALPSRRRADAAAAATGAADNETAPPGERVDQRRLRP
jgi:PAS domain S-box-containing protein